MPKKNENPFKKRPEQQKLSVAEKKAMEDRFLNLESTEPSSIPETKKIKEHVKKEKEPIKSIFIRAPQSYWEDLQEIVNITGISMNAVCLELLRPAIKKKLRSLSEEY